MGKVACLDQFIGWTLSVRQKNLYRVINNTSFLILQFVPVPNLASHLLNRCIRLIITDWQHVYTHRPVLLDTFIHIERQP